jgi:hypothetical protein
MPDFIPPDSTVENRRPKDTQKTRSGANLEVTLAVVQSEPILND